MTSGHLGNYTTLTDVTLSQIDKTGTAFRFCSTKTPIA
jgi:hypothetical protein